MRKRWLAIVSAVCMLALLLAGCGREMASNGGAPGDGYYTGDVTTDSDMSVESESTAESTTPRKVIVTLEFTLQVQDFTAASKALEKLVGESDGYIEYAHVPVCQVDGGAIEIGHTAVPRVNNAAVLAGRVGDGVGTEIQRAGVVECGAVSGVGIAPILVNIQCLTGIDINRRPTIGLRGNGLNNRENPEQYHKGK